MAAMRNKMVWLHSARWAVKDDASAWWLMVIPNSIQHAVQVMRAMPPLSTLVTLSSAISR